MVSVIFHFHLKYAARTIMCNSASVISPPNYQLLSSPPHVRVDLMFILTYLLTYLIHGAGSFLRN